MLSREEREELRQEMLEDARRDEEHERLMRTDDEFFMLHSSFDDLAQAIATFKRECLLYGQDYDYFLGNL